MIVRNMNSIHSNPYGWYLQLWSSQIEKMHALLVVESCRSLWSVLARKLSSLDQRGTVLALSKKIHAHFTRRFNFTALLVDDSDFVPYNGVSIQVPSLIQILNGLALSYNVSFIRLSNVF